MQEIARRTGKLPQALQEEPELYEDVRPYYEVFIALHRARPVGMGPGPIPLADIEAAGRLFRVRRMDYLVRVVQALDEVWLRWWAERQETHGIRSGSTTGKR